MTCQLSVALLQQWFADFNVRYFGGALPLPELKLSKARTRLGYMQCVCRRRGLLARSERSFSIHISTFYKCSERDFQTVLLHEMIHYYISFNRLRDTSSHGPLFRAHMERINSQGWHITVTVNTRGWEPAVRPRRPDCHLLLVVVTNRGERFISAVAKAAIGRIHADIARAGGQIVSEEWFVSHDARFDTFAKVRSLRGRKVKSEAEWNDYLGVMQRLDKRLLFKGV